MSPHPLAALAASARPTSVAGVIARLEAVEAQLPAASGVATFNRLYRWTTERVGTAITAGRFEDSAAMTALDIKFADLYFDALDAWARGGKAPSAWRPLFDRSDEQGIPAVHFALAGMHAHINRDLAVALAHYRGDRLTEGSPRFRDYVLINEVLGQASDEIRGRILPPLLTDADRALGEVDDQLVLRAIVTARRAAWEVGERLQQLIDLAPLFDAALRVLDISVGSTSRAILDPEGVIGA